MYLSLNTLSADFPRYALGFLQTWSQGHNMQGLGPDLQGQDQGLNSRAQGGLSKQILVCHYVKM